jgi:hypothetical protein
MPDKLHLSLGGAVRMFAALLVLCCLTASSDPQDDFPNLVVMETADAVGAVDQGKIRISLQQSATELKVDVRQLPCILVFHVSQATAAKLNITGSSTWQASGASNLYETWIVGEPSDYLYAGLMVNILEHQFGLNIEDSERTRVIQSVRLRLASTIHVEPSRKKGSRRKHGT